MVRRGTEVEVHGGISATANKDVAGGADYERHVFGVTITGVADVTFRWSANADAATYYTIETVSASGTTYINAAHPVLNVLAAITSGTVTVVHYGYSVGC
tara:strand:- start:1124 stop:1423 length:300 start_codon:yes stop_codon:yes gene_type:complete